MSLREIFGWSGGGLLLLLTIIQISPIKFNPWSWLAKHLGALINAEVLQELAEMRSELIKTKTALDNHIEEDDKGAADGHRQRILSVNIELMRGLNYTHEFFTDVLQDIDDYERYCTRSMHLSFSRAPTTSIRSKPPASPPSRISPKRALFATSEDNLEGRGCYGSLETCPPSRIPPPSCWCSRRALSQAPYPSPYRRRQSSLTPLLLFSPHNTLRWACAGTLVWMINSW